MTANLSTGEHCLVIARAETVPQGGANDRTRLQRSVHPACAPDSPLAPVQEPHGLLTAGSAPS